MATELPREKLLAFGEIANSRKQLMAQIFRGTKLKNSLGAGSELLQAGLRPVPRSVHWQDRKTYQRGISASSARMVTSKKLITKMADIDSSAKFAMFLTNQLKRDRIVLFQGGNELCQHIHQTRYLTEVCGQLSTVRSR